ncbi:MAG TPA: trigger factor [Prolixibacteraceae bacterium]|nr:trigger factor [Prolixibacteraceae bacterium]
MKKDKQAVFINLQQSVLDKELCKNYPSLLISNNFKAETMNITRENIDELNAILTISVEKSDYEAAVNDILKNQRKKANMPGFRPGMVPAGLIKKMYGKAALAEEVNKIISNSLNDYIRAENLNVLGEPLPDEEKQPAIDWDTQSDFSFVYDIGMAPSFEVTLDKKMKVPYYSIIADDEMVDKQVEAYAGRLGENKPADSVEDKDTVRGTFVQLDEAGNELEGGIVAEKVVIAIDVMKDQDIKASFLGKVAGDVVIFDPVKAYDNKHEVGHMLNISHEQAEVLTGDFKFTIEEILRFEKSPLNEELFAKIYGEDAGITTEEEFRARVKAEIEENFIYSSNYKFYIDSSEILKNKIQFDLPKAFLKRWIKVTNVKMTEEQIDTDFDNFMVDLKWQLIKDKIVKDNDLKITEEDVRALAKEMALMQFKQYGLSNVADEHLENYANHMLKNEDERRKLVAKKQDDIILEAIKEKVSLDMKEISFEEFNKMLEK